MNQDYSKEELAKVVDDLLVKEGIMYVCKSCGRSAKWVSDMRKHVEIHIEGLSFPCPHCDKTFRSRYVLKGHKKSHHTNLLL